MPCIVVPLMAGGKRIQGLFLSSWRNGGGLFHMQHQRRQKENLSNRKNL